MKPGDTVTLLIAGKPVEVKVISQEDDGLFHGSIDEKTLISFKMAGGLRPEKKPFLQSFFKVGQTKQSEWLNSLND